jgi:hypothetical protein
MLFGTVCAIGASEKNLGRNKIRGGSMTSFGPTRKETSLVARNKGDNNDVYTFSRYSQKKVPPPPSEYTTWEGNRLTTKNWWRISGWDIPNYHARVRAGELMVHTPFYSFQQYGTTEGNKDQTKVDGSYTIYTWLSLGQHASYEFWYPSEENVNSLYVAPNITDDYVQEAAAKLYTEGHDTLTFLAELHQVKRMFFEVGKRLLTLNKLLPFGLKSLSNDWLQARYGWRTLMYDLEDLNKAIKALSEESRARHSSYAYHKFTVKQSFEYEDEPWSFGTRYHTWQDSVEVNVRGSVTADIDLAMFQIDPLQTVWEITRLSFVLDWFISIGKMLASISFLSQVETYSASYGIQVTVDRVYDMYTSFNTGYSGTDWQTGSSWTQVQKRIPCNIPLLPHIRVNLNAAKILDLLALIIQHRT